uniref:Uncharacterized protein n=1 Tax=Noctiluca scintillans TaxID=2966 RepID=A0A7S1FJV6_NOCSC
MCSVAWQLGICAVGGYDLIQSYRAACKGPAGEGVLKAVCRLQDLGLNVILVTGASGTDDAFQSVGHDPSVDRNRFLRIASQNDDRLGVVHVAEEYCCPFALSDNVDSAATWTLPLHQRDWARRVRNDLQVRFTFDASGIIEFLWPSPLARHLGQSGNESAGVPSWLPDEVRFGAEVRTDQQPDACVVVVHRGAREEHLLCVMCDDPTAGLLRSAKTRAAQVAGLGSSGLHEIDGADEALSVALKNMTGRWTSTPFMVVTVPEGRHAGVRAVGVGSNLKKRRRAANLALAVTTVAHSEASLSSIIGPESEHVRKELVDFAHSALEAQRGLT